MLHHRLIKLAIFIIFINALVKSQPLGSTDKQVRHAPVKSQARNPFAPNSAIFNLPVLKTINLDFRNASDTKIQTELLRVLKNSLQNKELQQEKLIINVKPPKNSNSSFAKNFTSLLKNETTYLVPDGIVGAQSTIFKKKNGEISNLRLTLYVIRQKQSNVNKKSQKTKTHHGISPETLTEKANINVTQTENLTATIGSVLKQLYENSTDNENSQNINIILSLISPTNFSLGQIKNLRQSIRQFLVELYPNTSNSIEARLLYKKRTHTSRLEFEIDIQSLKKIQEPLKQKLNLTMKSSDEETDKSLQNILKTLKTDLQRLIPDSDLVVQAQKVISDDLNKLSETLQSHREEPIKIKTSMDLTNDISSFEKELDKVLPSIANKSLKPVLLAFKITIPNDSTQDSISSDVCFLIKTLTNRIPAKTPFGDLDIELTLVPKFENKKPALKLAFSRSEILPESRKLPHATNITMPKILNLTEPKINIIKKINSTIVELAKQLSYNNTNEKNQFNISLIVPQNETKQYVESILNIMQEDIRILFPYTRILIQAQDMISKGLRILKLNIKLVNELEQEEKKADVLPIDLSKLDKNVSQGLEELLKPWLPYMKRKRTTTFDLKLRPVNDISRPRLGNDICSIVDTLTNFLPKDISLNDIILQTTVLPDKEQKLPVIEEYSEENLQKRVYNTLKELSDELANHTSTVTKGLNFTLSIQSQENLTTQENTEEIIKTIKKDLLKLAPYADIIIELQKSIEDELNTLELNINLQYKKPIKKFKIDLNELGEFLPEEVDEVVYNIRNSENPFSFALEMAIPEDTDLEAANSEICSVSNVVINNIPKESLLTGSILRVTVSPTTKNNLKNTQNLNGNSNENNEKNENSKEQLKNYIPINPTTEEENILPFKSPTDKIDSNLHHENILNDSVEEEKEGTSEILPSPLSFALPKEPISIPSQQSQITEPLENLNSYVSQEKEENSEVPTTNREMNPIQKIKGKPNEINKNIPNIDHPLLPSSVGPSKNQISIPNHKLHPLKTPSSDLSQEKTIDKGKRPIKPTQNKIYKPKTKNMNSNIPHIAKSLISPSFSHMRIPISYQNEQFNPQVTTKSFIEIEKDKKSESPKESGILNPIKTITSTPNRLKKYLNIPYKPTASSPRKITTRIQPLRTTKRNENNVSPSSADLRTPFTAEKPQLSPISSQIFTPPLQIPPESSDITSDLKRRISESPRVVVMPSRTGNTEFMNELSSEIQPSSTDSYDKYDEATSRCVQEDWEPNLENLSSTENPESQETMTGQPKDIKSEDENFTEENKAMEITEEEQAEEDEVSYITTEANKLELEPTTSRTGNLRTTTTKSSVSTKLQGIKNDILNGINSFTSAIKSIVQKKQTENPITVETVTTYTTETKNIPSPHFPENTDEVEENFLGRIIPQSTNSPLIELKGENISSENLNPVNDEINEQTPYSKNKPGIESENVNIVKKISSENAYPTTSEKIHSSIGKISPRSLSIQQKISKTRTSIPVANYKPLETENIPLVNTKEVEESSSENVSNENVKGNGRIPKKLRKPKYRSSKRRRHMKRGPKHSNINQNPLTPNKKANNKFPSPQKLDENKIKSPLIKAFDNDQKDVLKYVENLDLSNSSRNLNDTILNIAISAVKVIPRDENETLELTLNILPPSNITVNTVMNITDSVLSSLVSLYPNDIVNVVTGITDKNSTITRLQIEITISNNKKLINQIEKENNLQDKMHQESKIVQNLTKILDTLVEDVKRETVIQNDLQSVPYYETSLKDIKSFLKTSLYTVVSEISSSVVDNSEAKNLNFTFSLKAPVVVNTHFVDHFKDLLRVILVNSLPFDDISVSAKLLKNDSNTAIKLAVDLEPRKVFTTSPIDLDDVNILDVEWVLSETIFGYISGLKKAQVPNKSIIINFIFETSHISSLNLDNIETAIDHVFDSLKIQGELRTEDIKLGLTKKNKIIIKLPFLISSSDFGVEDQEASTTPKPLEIISDLILAI